MTSQARRRLRSLIAEAARDAKAAGVPAAEITTDLRGLAAVYDQPGDRPAVTPEEE